MRRSPPKFSLVMSTIHRTIELKRFLTHLADQTYKNFELIIVDQNDDDRLVPIINEYRDKFPIIHIRSEKGTSLGRNRGIEIISGTIVAFPDDDCWYEESLLQKVTDLFINTPYADGISGRPVNENKKTSLGKFDKKSGEINLINIWQRINANTMFLKREVVEAIGFFDEGLGPGAGTKWGAAEDIDYPIRALKQGFTLFYYYELTVYHQHPITEYNERDILRGYAYACGMGRVLKKHRYPLYFIGIKLFYQLGGMAVALIKMETNGFNYHKAVFEGRLEGWLSRID